MGFESLHLSLLSSDRQLRAFNPIVLFKLSCVIPGVDGARKVRWSASGRGNRGGARVIYFNQLAEGFVILIAVNTKSEQSSLASKMIRGAKHEAEKH